MIVKDPLSPLERTRKILEGQNGTLLTADLAKFNIPRTYLSILERNGEIERVSRGVYRAKDVIEDELFRPPSHSAGRRSIHTRPRFTCTT